jgi:2'-5' RNA ligase
MKIFFLALEFELDEKPNWLDGFRIKYDEPFNYHLTLKYATFIKKNDLPKLKEAVKSLAKASKPMTLEFDQYFFNKTETGNLIMVVAKYNKDLFRLHKMVVSELGEFGETWKPYYKDFESNFKPHISIARNLSDGVFQIAKGELKEQIYCKAKISNLALRVVDENFSVDDFNDPQNLTCYDFGDRPNRGCEPQT